MIGFWFRKLRGLPEPLVLQPRRTRTYRPSLEALEERSLPALTTLIPAGAVWKYLDNGSDQGSAWQATAFADDAWASGPAKLGYGEGDEGTVVSFGPSPSAKYITTYFRHAFDLGGAAYASLNLGLLRDDGAVVYLNGVEVYRSNLPTGAVTFATKATTAVGGSDEDAFLQTGVNPSLLAAGTNVVAVEVHQSDASSSDLSFNLVLTGDTSAGGTNQPPTLAAIGSQSVNEQQVLTFTAQGNDADAGDTLTYSLLAGGTAVPAGAGIGSSTGVFSWTPAEAQDGSHNFKVRVSDAVGAFAEEQITVTVGEVNQLPVLAAIGNKLIGAGSPLSFTISASDADLINGSPNALTYWTSGLPAGASFDPGTRTFSWTPDAGQIGSYPVTFGVNDGIVDDSEGITIEVTNEATPVTLSFQDGVSPSSTYAGTRDTRLRFSTATTNYGTAVSLVVDGDPDDATLLQWDLGSIPRGSTIQAVTLSLTVTDPSSEAYQIYEMKRSWAEGEATWDVFASGAGNGWETAGAQGSQDRGATVLGTITSSTNGLKTFAWNAAGLALVRSWVDLPGTNHGVVIQNYVSATNGLDFSSSENATAANRPRLTVTYIPGSGTPNQPPTLSAIGNKSVNEQDLLTFTAQGSDPDAGDTLSYSLLAGATAVPSGATINAGTGVFNWTPGEAQDGSHDFKIRVTDAAGAFAEEQITVTVAEVNQLPVLAAIGNKSVNVGNTLSFTISATDADLVSGSANTLSYSATGLPAGASFNAGTRTFTWAPSAGQVGNHAVAFGVNDGVGDDSEGITIQVTSEATPVTQSFQDGVSPTSTYAGTRDTRIRFSSPTTNYGTATSIAVDGEPDDSVLLKWDLGSIPAGSTIQAVTVGLNITDKSSHTYEIYELKRNWAEGQATWNIFAGGAGNGWETAGAQGALDRGSTVLGTVTTSTVGFKTFTLNAAALALVQTWVNYPGTNRGFIIQDYVNATDGIDLSTREFATAASRPKLTITYLPGSGVPPPNQPPVATNDSLTVPKGGSGLVNVLANDTDPEGGPLTVSSFTQPAHGGLSQNGGVFTYTPQATYSGPDSFNYTVQDSEGLTASASVSITVTATTGPYTFRVMGDVPYTSSEFAPLEADLANVAASDRFFVHLGDIKSGSSACTSSYYAQVADTLKTSTKPLFIVPGDNEWNDCSNPSAAWNLWTANFMRFEDNWTHNFTVAHQSARPENFAFVENSTLFIGLNLPGSDVGSLPEWDTVVQADANWITQNFNTYGSQVSSVVLFAQAYPDSDRQPAGNALVAAAQAFNKPVLYMMGDLHVWQLDHPFTAAPNITRVVVDSGSPSVRVTLTGDPNNPFVFDRTP